MLRTTNEFMKNVENVNVANEIKHLTKLRVKEKKSSNVDLLPNGTAKDKASALVFNGTAFVTSDLGSITPFAYNDLSDVTITNNGATSTPYPDDVLSYIGTEWRNTMPFSYAYGTGITTIGLSTNPIETIPLIGSSKDDSQLYWANQYATHNNGGYIFGYWAWRGAYMFKVMEEGVYQVSAQVQVKPLSTDRTIILEMYDYTNDVCIAKDTKFLPGQATVTSTHYETMEITWVGSLTYDIEFTFHLYSDVAGDGVVIDSNPVAATNSDGTNRFSITKIDH